MGRSIAAEFGALLMRKAAEGVRVALMYDSVGSLGTGAAAAVQIVMPPALLSRSIGKPVLTRAVERAVPLLVRLERISRPRLTVLGSRYAIPVIGLLILVLALGLVVAAPFIGQIPLGLAVCLVGLGLVERDGLLILAGAAFGAVGLVLSAGFAYAIVSGIHGLFF